MKYQQNIASFFGVRMFRNCSLLFVLSVVITACGSVHFNKEPPKVVYVSKGRTARLVWEYYVDNRDGEFDINSPKWNFYPREGDVMNIASEDIFQNWKWVIHRDTCPPRLLNPIRVYKESQATLVIKNVTKADVGVYGCSLVLLRTSLPINSKVSLSVIENQALTSTLKSTSSTIKQPTSTSFKGNVTKMFKNMTDEAVQVPLLPFKGRPAINKSLSDNIVNSWKNKSLFLRCIVNGPARTFITWYSPNGYDITNASRLTNNGSQLSMITQRDSDFGLYTCRAENIFGLDEHIINVTNSCQCPTVKNSPKASSFLGRKDSGSENKSPGLKNKKLNMICLAIIGVTWIANVFLILQSRTISKPEMKSGSCFITDKIRQV